LGIFNRLFSRSSSTPGERSGPGTPLPQEPMEGLVVPADHHVSAYGRATEPGLRRTHGGAFIVNLGSSSDDFQEELREIADEVDRSVSVAGKELGKTHPPIVLLAAEASRLSELFAPNDIKVDALHGLLIWVIDAGVANLWLRDPEPLLAAVRRAGAYRLNDGPMTQLVLFGFDVRDPEVPPGTLELARRLSEIGVPVAAVPGDGVLFREVCRPDCVIGSLRTAPLPNVSPSTESGSRPEASHFVARAPRLRRLVLAAMEMPTEEAPRRLLEELVSRRIGLLVMCDREGRIYRRSWEGIGEALAVYPDVLSFSQAVEDLRLSPGSLAWATFPPRDLFTWVDQQSFTGLALNAYQDRTTPKYFFIERGEIEKFLRVDESSGFGWDERMETKIS
jgi:hypothetical protein